MHQFVVLIIFASLFRQYYAVAPKYTSALGGVGMGGMMGGMGMGGMGMGGMGMGGMGMGGMGMGGMGMRGFGGSVIDQSQFQEGKKHLDDLFFKKAEGGQGGQFGLGQSGFHSGEDMKKLLKGEQGSFNGFSGGKNLLENGVGYQGAKHFDKHGKKGGQENEKKGQKKGHVVKGFKTSSQKDENSETEEYYDEEHDEAGKAAFDGQQGQFGENNGLSYKGEKENKEFKAGQEKKGGQYANKFLTDKENAAQGKYGGKKYAGNQAAYALNKGGDEKMAGGHHEANGLYKHYPIYY